MGKRAEDTPGLEEGTKAQQEPGWMEGEKEERGAEQDGELPYAYGENYEG